MRRFKTIHIPVPKNISERYRKLFEKNWYMQSRGIAYAEAIQLLLSGFINDVVQTVSIESVRERIRTAIVHKL
jgi:hypothetical protein